MPRAPRLSATWRPAPRRRAQGALGGGKEAAARKEAPPPVDAFLAEALTDLGDDSDLSAPMAAHLGVEALAPLADVLKARRARRSCCSASAEAALDSIACARALR